MKLKLPNLPGLPQQKNEHMKYNVQDDTYMDRYNEVDRKRAPRPHLSSNRYIVWTTLGVFLFSGAFFLLILAVLYRFMGAVVGNQLTVLGAFKYLVFDSAFHKILWLVWLVVDITCTVITYYWLYRNWKVQNVRNDTSDLNQYHNDSRLTQPEEMIHHFQVIPDAGMHYRSIRPTAIIGHMMLNNNGIHKIQMLKRYSGHDPDHPKNTLVLDENGKPIAEKVPLFDEKFGETLFDSAQLPQIRSSSPKDLGRRLRQRYDPRKLIYNSGNHEPGNPKGREYFDQLPYSTLAEVINHEWYMPSYEVQRPGGAYVVDSGPANTMVLAITRAGKGQTYIEPTIDSWLRMDEKANIVINDPKGELYLKFFYPAQIRGYQVIVFNLMNEAKTNIYNPLGYAVDASRRGDIRKVQNFVQEIGDVFFPPDKADDPMWPHAANAAFQRAALVLIDYYQEEEYTIQQKAIINHWTQAKLNRVLDVNWGHVTLYNVYQLMTALSATTSDNPEITAVTPEEMKKLDKWRSMNDQQKMQAKASGEYPAKDYLTLLFDATAQLPPNRLRGAVSNQDRSLRAMAKSEKTMASVNGISLTAMKFFADPTIASLTSGRPSQNFDIVGMAFPRRFEIHLNSRYSREHALQGARYYWTVYEDSNFTKPLGKEFNYENVVSDLNWIMYKTKAIFKPRTVYLKLDIKHASTGLLMKTFYFEFTKGYQLSLDGRVLVVNPVTKKYIVKDGSFEEMQPVTVRSHNNSQATHTAYKKQPSIYEIKKLMLTEANQGKPKIIRTRMIDQINVHYSEEPRTVFFVTPPHLLSYAKIILILENQIFNVQVANSYLTNRDQKPDYPTFNMLDEAGNLQSEGSGIPGLQRKLSIGLGQGQYYSATSCLVKS